MDNKKIWIQCFGNFEVFYEGIPVSFRYRKAKELLAYLVHKRGSTVTVRELAAVLYEMKGDTASLQSQIRNLIACITGTFAEVGCTDLIYRSYGTVAIITKAVDCDYFRYLDGIPGAERALNGEYMTQYSWAEDTAYRIYKRAE